MSGAGGKGHVGIMAIDPVHGSASYGAFNPAHDGWWDKFYDKHGTVAPADFPAGTIQYEDGRPTQDSLAKVAAVVAAADKQGKGAIRAAFFKTTDAQTAALREFIKRTAAKPPAYNVTGYNCQVFCILGLRAAGINAAAPARLYEAEPNVYFALTLSELAWRLGSSQEPRVETSYCFNSEKGCIP